MGDSLAEEVARFGHVERRGAAGAQDQLAAMGEFERQMAGMSFAVETRRRPQAGT